MLCVSEKWRVLYPPLQKVGSSVPPVTLPPHSTPMCVGLCHKLRKSYVRVMRVATVRQNLEAMGTPVQRFVVCVNVYISIVCMIYACAINIDYTFSLDCLVMRNGDKKEEDID